MTLWVTARESPEDLLIAFRRVLERVGELDQAGDVLLGMPAIARESEPVDGAEAVRLRWVGIHAADPGSALQQVAGAAQALMGIRALRAVRMVWDVVREPE